MKLMLVHKWAEKYFDEDSRPDAQLIGRWCRNGKIPATKVVGQWYVDEHAWLAGGDDLVASVLAAA